MPGWPGLKLELVRSQRRVHQSSQHIPALQLTSQRVSSPRLQAVPQTLNCEDTVTARLDETGSGNLQIRLLIVRRDPRIAVFQALVISQNY